MIFFDPTRSDGTCRDCRHAAERRSKTDNSRGIGGGAAGFRICRFRLCKVTPATIRYSRFEENDMDEAMTARRGRRRAPGLMLGISLAVTLLAFQSRVLPQSEPPKQLIAIPPNKDTDLKFYQTDGQILNGVEALEHMTNFR
jgi:hypothetical protein